MTGIRSCGGERLAANLRALGADVERLPEIPDGLADYIAELTPEGLERIRGDVQELRRIGLLSAEPTSPAIR